MLPGRQCGIYSPLLLDNAVSDAMRPLRGFILTASNA
jgi:hypothetical protein